jgi:hypothetical protein
VVLASVVDVKPAEAFSNPTGFDGTFNPPTMVAKGIRHQGATFVFPGLRIASHIIA